MDQSETDRQTDRQVGYHKAGDLGPIFETS